MSKAWSAADTVLSSHSLSTPFGRSVAYTAILKGEIRYLYSRACLLTVLIMEKAAALLRFRRLLSSNVRAHLRPDNERRLIPL